jgi:hypothetical protein
MMRSREGEEVPKTPESYASVGAKWDSFDRQQHGLAEVGWIKFPIFNQVELERGSPQLPVPPLSCFKQLESFESDLLTRE